MPAQVPPAGRRDPFSFARARGALRTSAVRRSVRAEVAVDEPAAVTPVAAPLLALAGIATVRGRGEVAVVSIDGALHYAARGEVIANRYRVDEIVDRAVDVFDLMLGTKSRLILQRP